MKSPNQESFADQISRVRGMAAGGETWDLSDNDRAALNTVLEVLDKTHTLRPAGEYYDELGFVIWWHLPISEPPEIAREPDSIPEGYPDGWQTRFSLLPDQRLLRTSDGAALQ